MDTKTLFAPQKYGERGKPEALACLWVSGGEG
jgi:hypothetical protein